MVTMKTIRAFARRIAEEFRPRRIILFGSYACGTPTEESDVDLMVVFGGRGSAADRALEILLATDYPGFSLDLLVRTESEIRRRVRMNDWFLKDIIEHGKVIYEADAGMDREGGRRSRARRARLRVRKSPAPSAICFHAQQCVEKYFKARLCSLDLPIPRSHDLVALLHAVKLVNPEWMLFEPACKTLNRYAVSFRYPGESAGRAEARTAVKHARLIRDTIRSALGLRSAPSSKRASNNRPSTSRRKRSTRSSK